MYFMVRFIDINIFLQMSLKSFMNQKVGQKNKKKFKPLRFYHKGASVKMIRSALEVVQHPL